MEFELPRCLAQLARFDTSGEFDKDRVLEIHKEGYKQFTDLGDKKPLFNFSNYLPTAAELSRPSPRLKRLRPIALSQLEPGERSRGRVLYGTLCVDAFKVTGIMTCLEDEAGDAVRVSIYNAAPSNCTLADVQKLFPKGTKVAIKEPFLKLATDGMFIVRVDQPANVVTLERSPSQTQSSDPDELRSEGNRCFADGDWERAIEYYSKCIAAVESHGSSMPSSKTMNPKEKIAGAKDARGALMLAYSNRSEAWMKLRNYQKALTDSQSALELDPTHLKSIFRKGRALHGVEQYEKACACFEAALEKHPGEKELEGALEKSRRCLKGQFLLGRGCRKEDDPMCSSSDYSGTLQEDLGEASLPHASSSKGPEAPTVLSFLSTSASGRVGLFRTPISGGVQSATSSHGLPHPALAVRNLMEQARFAHLCTVMSRMHHRRRGYPFGSLVDFAPDSVGHPIFSLSPLAIHTRNLLADPKCTLVVQVPGWSGLSNARVTIFGDVYPLPEEQQEWAHKHYAAKHQQGTSEQWGNFCYYRMNSISDIYFIGGFGTVAWVDINEYENAQPDVIAANGAEQTLKELNTEFSKPLRELLSAESEVDDAALISIDSKGTDIRVRQGAQFNIQRLSFEEGHSIETLDQAKVALQKLLDRWSKAPGTV